MKRRRLLVGALLVVGIGVAFAASAQLSQWTQRSGVDAPFFILWFNSLFFFVLGVPYAVERVTARKRRTCGCTAGDGDDNGDGDGDGDGDVDVDDDVDSVTLTTTTTTTTTTKTKTTTAINDASTAIDDDEPRKPLLPAALVSTTRSNDADDAVKTGDADDADDDANADDDDDPDDDANADDDEGQLVGDDGRVRVATPAFVVAIVLFYALATLASYSYTRALDFVSASLCTALFSTAPVFVYVLSLGVLRRTTHVRALPLAAMALVVLASLCIARPWRDADGNGDDADADADADAYVQGVSCALAAALAAALYKVAFKVAFGRALSARHVGALLACFGVCGVVAGTFVAVALDAFAVERSFSLGVAALPWAPLVATALATLVFNFAIAFGIVFTYPLFISVGTVLGIPINVVVDATWHRHTPDAAQLAGMVGIVVAFALLLVDDARPRALRRTWLGRALCVGVCGGTALRRGGDNNDDAAAAAAAAAERQ